MAKKNILGMGYSDTHMATGGINNGVEKAKVVKSDISGTRTKQEYFLNGYKYKSKLTYGGNAKDKAHLHARPTTGHMPDKMPINIPNTKIPKKQ